MKRINTAIYVLYAYQLERNKVLHVRHDAITVLQSLSFFYHSFILIQHKSPNDQRPDRTLHFTFYIPDSMTRSQFKLD